jgi:hypothetical protein
MSWNQSGLTLKHTIRAGSTKRNLLVSSSFNDLVSLHHIKQIAAAFGYQFLVLVM